MPVVTPPASVLCVWWRGIRNTSDGLSGTEFGAEFGTEFGAEFGSHNIVSSPALSLFFYRGRSGRRWSSGASVPWTVAVVVDTLKKPKPFHMGWSFTKNLLILVKLVNETRLCVCRYRWTPICDYIRQMPTSDGRKVCTTPRCESQRSCRTTTANLVRRF